MTENLNRTRSQMVNQELGALLVTQIDNAQWLTGFTGTAATLLITESSQVFITDSRYAVQANEQVKGWQIIIFQSPRKLADVVAEAAAKLGVTRVGFEPAMSYSAWESWVAAAPSIEWVPAKDLLEPLRMIKTPDEVEKIRKACALADACMQHAFRMVQPGVREYDLGLDIEFFFRKQGAEIAFPPIVVSGPNSAKPHGRPGERTLQQGDFVTLDIGARLDGYCSDITRTVIVGTASDKQKLVYQAVLESLEAALDAIKPGANGKNVDILVRDVLRKYDFEQYFGHGLGHGLGRAVHDFGGLTQMRDQPIAAGQVWTVEPGVYLEGFGGVRIEEDVVVTDTGIEILTHTPRGLTILP